MPIPLADSFEPLEQAYAPLIELLRARGADAWPHPGGTLLSHLVRTARRLESWGASRALITAGLCHAAYGTAGYPRPLFEVANRAPLREDIGDEAEAIVYAYCAFDRDVHGRELRDRFSGEYWAPSARMRRQLAELTIANELDVVEHAELNLDQLASIAALLDAATPHSSQAAWSAVKATSRLHGFLSDAAQSGDAELAYRDLGTHGERVLLWHGGAGPELTWVKQHGLAVAFQLRIPWRRGYSPSIPSARQDWTSDVRDLLRVMSDRSHVVSHSYGGLSALFAAAIAPERFASLTIIEAPHYAFALDDPELQQLASLGRAFARGAPEARTAFLALAGLPPDHPQTRAIERLARDLRDPGDEKPDLTKLLSARLPTAIVSGRHNGGLERMSDALSRELGAERWVLEGAGHAVPRQKHFNDRLTEFVQAHAR
jgi:pimeloyl-ACP methyl ester carboxylesterase